MPTQIATFAAGCFWGVEEAFRHLKGVVKTRVGFMGGHLHNPSYQVVCRGDTGHAEVVQVEFDPQEITYSELLNIFWDCHNPTTLNRQGADVGSQYRSAIFYHNVEQQTLAEEAKVALSASGKYMQPIVTEIVQASEFFLAEEYHQGYLEKHGRSCQ